MIHGDTDQETIELSVQILGMSRERAQEILAFENGQAISDIVILGDDGQPLPLDQQAAILGLEVSPPPAPAPAEGGTQL